MQDAHEKKAFKLWEEVLDMLEKKKSKELARKVEWLDRYFAIREQAKLSPDDPEVALGRGLHYKRLKQGLIDRVLKDDDLNVDVEAALELFGPFLFLIVNCQFSRLLFSRNFV